MVDTVALTHKFGMFKITEPDKFTPNANEILNATYQRGGRAFKKCVQNPSKRRLEQGIYEPRLTLIRRINKEGNPEISLKTELSLPKLLFNNNFDELEDKDFYETVTLLGQRLNSMGVQISEYYLAIAPVSLVHFSKNFVFTDGSHPSFYIQAVQKSNISQALDLVQTNYTNGGQSVKFRTNSYEVTFYDKLKELNKAKVSEKRVEEKDNSIQFDLFERKPVKKPFEILRMEIRLNQRQKIRQVLRKAGLAIEPNFHSLYNKKVAKTILLYHLDEIENNYPKVLYMTRKSAKDFIAQFVIDNPDSRIKDPITALGLYNALEELNMREIRQLLDKYQKSSWYSFIKQMNGFAYSKDRLSPFKPIRDAVNEFKPVKLVDFQEEMLNNDKDGK